MLNDRKYIFSWQEDPSPLIAVYLKLLLEEMENLSPFLYFSSTNLVYLQIVFRYLDICTRLTSRKY